MEMQPTTSGEDAFLPAEFWHQSMEQLDVATDAASTQHVAVALQNGITDLGISSDDLSSVPLPDQYVDLLAKWGGRSHRHQAAVGAVEA